MNILIFTKILLFISLLTFLSYLLWFTIFYLERFKNVNYQNDDSKQELFIMIPLLNEESTIFTYVKKMILELNHLHRLNSHIQTNIILINDASTDRTLENLWQLKRDLGGYPTTIHVLNRQLPNAQTGKGSALNFGLDFINTRLDTDDNAQQIVGIVDADGFISAADMQKVIGTFENYPVSMVQTAVSMNLSHHNWLSRMQDLEFLGANSFMQESRNRIGQAIASGNGQFMTFEMADSVRWGNSLLEDFEFTVRGLLKGYKTIFLPTAIVYQEAVKTLKPLFKQRIRWCQGSMQCFSRYAWKLFKSPIVKKSIKADMLLFLAMPFFSMILNGANTLSAVLQINNIFTQKPLPVFLIFGTVLLFTLYIWMLLGLEYGQNKNKIPTVRCILRSWECIIYNYILSFIPYFAFVRLLTGNKQWAKTEHGDSVDLAG